VLSIEDVTSELVVGREFINNETNYHYKTVTENRRKKQQAILT